MDGKWGGGGWGWGVRSKKMGFSGAIGYCDDLH